MKLKEMKINRGEHKHQTFERAFKLAIEGKGEYEVNFTFNDELHVVT